MSDLLPIAGLVLHGGRETKVVGASPDVEPIDNKVEVGWPSIALGIFLSGGAYPIVLALGYALVIGIRLLKFYLAVYSWFQVYERIGGMLPRQIQRWNTRRQIRST